MPAVTIPTPNIATDPGVLFWAPVGSTAPTNTVTGSVFTDAWPVAWIVLGATEEGHAFSWTTTTEPITVAEFWDPIRYVTTGRTGSIAFALASINATNVKRMLNGGTLTVTGATTTTMTTYTPPAMGTEVRCMIGWESLDSTERLIAYQCFNTGSVSIARRKGSDNANLPVEFSLEVPASGIPFTYATAGVARG